jgi:hypothetical protein
MTSHSAISDLDLPRIGGHALQAAARISTIPIPRDDSPAHSCRGPLRARELANSTNTCPWLPKTARYGCESLSSQNALQDGRIDAARELSSCLLMERSRRLQRDVGIDPESERLLPSVETIVVPPVSAAMWHDVQVQPSSVEQLSRVGRRFSLAYLPGLRRSRWSCRGRAQS